jgi:lipid A 3-O-deacylase
MIRPGGLVKAVLRLAAAGISVVMASALLGVAPVASQGRESDSGLLSIGLGYYDISDGDDGAADFRLEYRHNQGWWIIRPWIGLEATSDSAAYLVGGLLADVWLTDTLVLTPSLGVGVYDRGDGKDLGHTVEFRSQIELAYRFTNAARVGLAFGHISNASLDERNPGVNILSLYYHIPTSALFGR